MESPISGNSSSSPTTMSPLVHSPLPIRAPTLSRKAYDSVPFLDLLEESEDRIRFPPRAHSYVLEKLHKLTAEEMGSLEFGRRCSLITTTVSGEHERKDIVEQSLSNEHPFDDFRPPSRAGNPQIFDKEFVKMGQEVNLFRKVEKSRNRRVFDFM